MFVNVIQLEAEVKELKIQVQNKFTIKTGALKPDPTGKINNVEADNQSKQEEIHGKDDSIESVIISKSSTDGIKLEEGKQNNDLKCNVCDYNCKKQNILTKHMNNKHKTSVKLVKSKCLKIHEEKRMREKQLLRM